MDTPFVMELVYDVPVAKVWQALTVTAAMREWYFPQLIKFEPEVGFEFVFSNDGLPYQKKWQVTRVVPGKLLAHSWTYQSYPGFSEVTFELFPQDGQTKLRLSHSGIDSFPDDSHFARKRFEDGWATILNKNLRNYLAIRF